MAHVASSRCEAVLKYALLVSVEVLRAYSGPWGGSEGKGLEVERSQTIKVHSRVDLQIFDGTDF